jgi:hypothetical protein
MIKKKAAKKTTGKKKAKKGNTPRLKKETNPSAVRKQVSRIVESQAAKMTRAVVGEAIKGQLAPVKYLFDMANIFPGQTDPEKAPEENDNCLARILLDRIEAPPKPETEVEDEPEEEEAADGEKKPVAAGVASNSADGEKKEPAAAPVATGMPVTTAVPVT